MGSTGGELSGGVRVGKAACDKLADIGSVDYSTDLGPAAEIVS